MRRRRKIRCMTVFLSCIAFVTIIVNLLVVSCPMPSASDHNIGSEGIPVASCRFLWYTNAGQDFHPLGGGVFGSFMLQKMSAVPLPTPVPQYNNPYETEVDDLTIYKGEEGKRDLEQKQRLRKYCGRRKRKEPSNETLGHLYVFEKHKVIFCLVPKVASRQWIPLLGRYRVPLGYSPYGPTVKQFPPEKGQKMLQTFFKFMFVREPFERLVSAYKDKYLHPRAEDKDPFITKFGRKIIQNFRPNASQEALRSGYGVTWPEFVEYILNDGDKDDWHWANYLDVCGVCDIKYDYVGHYETMQDDASYVLQRANLSQLKFPGFRPARTKEELLQYYSQIPKSWINRLGDVYRSSFELFGYPIPGPLKNLLGSS